MKNQNKKMYVVRGSDDGNLGVYSNLKLAYAEAKRYMEHHEYPLKSYSKVCKEFKDNDYWIWSVDIVDDDKIITYTMSTNATIEKYYLNHK